MDMRRLAILLLLAAACSTPRNPYYPDLEETRQAREEPFTPAPPNGFLKLMEGLLGLLAKNT
jgi:hypothetical protein